MRPGAEAPHKCGAPCAAASRRRGRLPGAALWALLPLLIGGRPVAAENGPAADRPPAARADAARYMPDDVTFIAHAERLDAVEAALKRVNAWRLLSLAAGRAGTVSVFSFRPAVADALGVRNAETIERLLGCRVTVGGHSWRQPESWVWWVQPVDDALLEQWFPPAARQAVSRAGNTLMFTTTDGRAVAVRSDVAAVTHAERGRSLFDQVKARMTGDGGGRESRAGRPAGGDEGGDDRGGDFRQLAQALPAGCMVTVLWHPHPPSSGRSEAEPPPAAGARAAAIGVVEEADRLRVEYRSIGPAEQREWKLGAAAIELVQRLPDETLLAWAAQVDLKAHLGQLIDRVEQSPGILAKLGAWPVPDDLRNALLEGFGDHLVVVWGQSAGSHAFWPQIAVMVELVDAATAVQNLETFLAGRLSASSAASSDGGAVRRTVVRETHLGRTLYWWRDDASTTPTIAAGATASAVVPGLEPAMAVVDGWLIAALSRDHVRRIIEARSRLSPGLNRLPLLGKTSPELAAGGSVAVMQPALASTVLVRWMQDAAEGRASILSADWWPSPPQPVRTRRIGITVRVNNDPGEVQVVHVYPDSPVAGLIEPGDRIVGVDGSLLSMAQSNVDLRTRLAESTAAAGPTVRVLRDGVMLDVTLPIDTDVDWAPGLDPPTLLRELAAIGRRFDFAGFCTAQPDPQSFSATLVLKYREPRSP